MTFLLMQTQATTSISFLLFGFMGSAHAKILKPNPVTSNKSSSIQNRTYYRRSKYAELIFIQGKSHSKLHVLSGELRQICLFHEIMEAIYHISLKPVA